MYKLMRFPGWADKAVTLSYDDGTIEDIRLIEIMQKYGLKGTFNLCADLSLAASGKRAPIDVYLGSGMEVAMHGKAHLWVKACTGADIIKEFYQDKLALEAATGEIMRGGAYAYGCYNDEAVATLKTLGLSYFRGIETTGRFDIPTDWHKWPLTCRHKDEKLFSLLDKFLTEPGADRIYLKTPRLFYLMGHSREFTADNNWDLIEKFGERVAGRSDVWHATNIEIYDYVKAYEGLIFSATGDKVLNNSATDVYLWVDGKNLLAPAGKTVAIEK